MGVSQIQFANHFEWSYARLHEIINGRRGVSKESAMAFTKAEATTSEFWFNLQRNYQFCDINRYL